MLPVPQKKSSFDLPKNQAVMEQVKKQRQPAEPMDVIDILEKSVGERGGDPVQFNNELSQLVNSSPNFRIMRANNSLFIYINNKDKTAQVYLETADTPRDLVDSIRQFGLAMKKSGFKTGKFEVQNPLILKAVKMAGIPVSLQSTNTVSSNGQTPLMQAVMEF